MKLSRDSKLVRWAYFLSEQNPPKHTNLCNLFWRTVLLTPLKLSAFLCLLGTVLLAALILPVMQLGWWGLLVTPTVLGIIYIIFFTVDRRSGRQTKSQKPPGLVKEAIKAIKERYCPLITLE